MLGYFLAGLIVGALLGLAIAPLLRSWMLWQMANTWRDHPSRQENDRDNEATTTPTEL